MILQLRFLRCSMAMEVRVAPIRIGREVAEYARRHFPGELAKNPNYMAGNYEKALTETFLAIDNLLMTEAGLKEIHDLQNETNQLEEQSKNKNPLATLSDEGPEGKGCTANVILIKNKVMYIANAGDSRSVLAVKEHAIDLTIDHKPENDKEKARIAKAGGTVTNGRVEGNLNLSRALGDLRYKKNTSMKPEEQMITAMPDVYKQAISKDFDFVIMGCDGIYDQLSSQQIVDHFYKEMKAKPEAKLVILVENFLDSLVSPDYVKTEGAGCDNMTCLIIKFKKE